MDGTTALRLHAIRREVLASRRRGRVLVEFDDGVDVTTDTEARLVADQMIALLNLPSMGSHWTATDRVRSAEIVTAVLNWDMETFRQREPDQAAHELTERFLAECGTGAFYLTNVRADADLGQSPQRWASIAARNELDAGVVVVSRALSGLIWVKDRVVPRQ